MSENFAGGLVQVPVLAEGQDPAAHSIEARSIETLRLDGALLPPLDPGAKLVAYRLSAHGARRAPESVRAGDCVVVLLGGDPPGPDAPCATLVGGRVEIVRAREVGAHLPSRGGPPDSSSLGARAHGLDRGVLVGRVVMAFHRWL